MNGKRITISLALTLAAAFIYYVVSIETTIAIALPVAVHELAHIIALRFFGLKVKSVRAELTGLCIDYCGFAEPVAHITAAFAGPAGGFIYAYAASLIARETGCAWMELSAGISLLLSVFNLLPVLPLDGGRILLGLMTMLFGARTGERIAYRISIAITVLLLIAGTVLAFNNGSKAPAAAALWLMLAQRNGGAELFKEKEC